MHSKDFIKSSEHLLLMSPEANDYIFNEWVNKYSDQLYSWALHKTSRKEIAEDLVQETFLAAVKSFEKFKNLSEPKTWLFSILRNKIADHFREAFRKNEKNTISFDAFFDENENWIMNEIPQHWDGMEDQHLLDNVEFNKVFSECINALPEQWNASIVLKFIENRDAKEICQDLNISSSNYWQILHRAKLQLRKCIELKWFKDE